MALIRFCFVVLKLLTFSMEDDPNIAVNANRVAVHGGTAMNKQSTLESIYKKLSFKIGNVMKKVLFSICIRKIQACSGMAQNCTYPRPSALESIDTTATVSFFGANGMSWDNGTFTFDAPKFNITT